MVGYTEIGHKRGSRRSVVMSANRTSSEAGRFPWLPCRSAPDRVCRAAFDHSRCVMDTCGLERVERVRINLNEKNLASQRNTLTSDAFIMHDFQTTVPSIVECTAHAASRCSGKAGKCNVLAHFQSTNRATMAGARKLVS